jgi:hypothetical protein
MIEPQRLEMPPFDVCVLVHAGNRCAYGRMATPRIQTEQSLSSSSSSPPAAASAAQLTVAARPEGGAGGVEDSDVSG